MFNTLRYAAFKAVRDFLVAGLGTAAITYGFREFTGGDPADLPTFVAALAVWRVIRGHVLRLLVQDFFGGDDV